MLPTWLRTSHLSHLHTAALLVAASLLFHQPAHPESRGWRTDGTGCYPAARPVTTWSLTQNVIWKTQMPSWGNATPVLTRDQLFVCAETSTLVCVGTGDGKILWQRSCSYADLLSEAETAKAREDEAKARQLLAERGKIEKQIQELRKKVQQGPAVTDDLEAAEDEHEDVEGQIKQLQEKSKKLQAQAGALDRFKLPGTHNVNGHSTPTPVTDGNLVCVLFGTGVAAAFDLEGNRKWIKMLLKPRQGWGHSASPLLVGKLLIAHIADHLIALDRDTGEELWRTPARVGWGSPIQSQIGEEPVIITANGDLVRARDGKRLAGGLCSLNYSAPVATDGIVYFIDGERTSLALKLPDQASDTIRPETLWSLNGKLAKERYYASPVVYRGLVYGITQRNVLSALDAKTGDRVYEQALNLGGGTVYPSIAAAGDHVFVSSDNGTTIVLKAQREYEEVAKNRLETFRSCPVFVGDRIYIRAVNHLYCIGPM